MQQLSCDSLEKNSDCSIKIEVSLLSHNIKGFSTTFSKMHSDTVHVKL